MEGWLLMPPERNLIGRSVWKLRYVRFSNNQPASLLSSRASIITAPPTRPTTSASFGSAVTVPVEVDSTDSVNDNATDIDVGFNANSNDLSNRTKISLEKCHSTHIVSTLALASPTLDAKQWNLAVFKNKTDTEPLVRYPIQRMATCYIGEVTASKKKSPVIPTLTINLHPPETPPLSSASSTRSFRRRSQEVNSRDGLRRDRSGTTTLLFRPEVDDKCVLERWANEIQLRLLSHPPLRGLNKSNSVRGNFGGCWEVADAAYQERYQESYYETPAPSPSSLFLVNGEPNTALLSPSIRSKASSSLSVVDSDDRESLVSSSATSEMVSSMRTNEERCPPSVFSEQERPSFAFKASPLAQVAGSIEEASLGTTVSCTPPRSPSPPGNRPETILDRFFSSAAPNHPEIEFDKSMSSIARFEALMAGLESSHSITSMIPENSVSQQKPSFLSPGQPRRIPSPTRRALEFVCTGQRRQTPSPPQSPLPMSPTSYIGPFHVNIHGEEANGPSSPNWTVEGSSPTYLITPPTSQHKWRDSDEVSLDTLHTTVINSTGISEPLHAPLSHGKRHSLADFSQMRSPLSPSIGINGGVRRAPGRMAGRRGSFNDVKHTFRFPLHSTNLAVKHVDRSPSSSLEQSHT